MVTETNKETYNDKIEGVVLYGKSTSDGALTAIKVNPATGAMQADTELTATIDPTGLATGAAQTTGNNSLSSIDGKLAKGDQTKASSLSVTPATDIADGRYIGDIKFGEELPAGTQILGKVGIDQATANANEVVVKTSALPSGASTSAKQDTIKTAIDAITTKLSADPATQTTLAALSAKFAALVDSQAPVVAGYKTKRVDVVFTGMDATSQYDAVGALVEVPNWATAVGRSATIREMRISVNNNAIAPQFEVHFFRAADATVAADNVTWTELAADYAKRAGYVTMPACAKSTGSGTIDMVRAVHTDGEFGLGLSKEICCAAASSSIWIKLKLLNSGISFAGTPGNTIVLSMVLEQS